MHLTIWHSIDKGKKEISHLWFFLCTSTAFFYYCYPLFFVVGGSPCNRPLVAC